MLHCNSNMSHRTFPYRPTVEIRPCNVRPLFPDNTYVTRLLDYLAALNVRLEISSEPEQWLYHPRYRTLSVWLPDLNTQPLSYIVVILAHEIGHVLDFDENPHYVTLIADLHWSEVPDHIELVAFTRGFVVLQQLHIPVTVQQYLALIEQPMSDAVARELLGTPPQSVAL